MRGKDLDPIDQLIARNIRKHRLSKQLTQTELGHAIGVTCQQLQKYESATNRISASRLFRIAQVLNVYIHQFFDGEDRPGATLKVQKGETAYCRTIRRTHVS